MRRGFQRPYVGTASSSSQYAVAPVGSGTEMPDERTVPNVLRTTDPSTDPSTTPQDYKNTLVTPPGTGSKLQSVFEAPPPQARANACVQMRLRQQQLRALGHDLKVDVDMHPIPNVVDQAGAEIQRLRVRTDSTLTLEMPRHPDDASKMHPVAPTYMYVPMSSTAAVSLARYYASEDGQYAPLSDEMATGAPCYVPIAVVAPAEEDDMYFAVGPDRSSAGQGVTPPPRVGKDDDDMDRIMEDTINAFRGNSLAAIRQRLQQQREEQLYQVSALLELSVHAQQLQAEHLGMHGDPSACGVDVLFYNDLEQFGLSKGDQPHSKAADRARAAVEKKRTRTAAMLAAGSAAAMASKPDCPDKMLPQTEDDSAYVQCFVVFACLDRGLGAPTEATLRLVLDHFFEWPSDSAGAVDCEIEANTLRCNTWGAGFYYEQNEGAPKLTEQDWMLMATSAPESTLLLNRLPRDITQAAARDPAGSIVLPLTFTQSSEQWLSHSYQAEDGAGLRKFLADHELGDFNALPASNPRCTSSEFTCHFLRTKPRTSYFCVPLDDTSDEVAYGLLPGTRPAAGKEGIESKMYSKLRDGDVDMSFGTYCPAHVKLTLAKRQK